MALSATIFKIQLNIADTDRGYYGDHNLTVARHPSETDERMMVRILAFICNAHERLQFTKGLCADDEPDLWQKALTEEIELWINVGQPDEKRLRKACSRSPRVLLYLYGGRTADIWWQQNAEKLARFEHLSIINLRKSATEELATLAERTLQLQCTLQDNQIWINNGTRTVEINPEFLLQSKHD